MSLGDKVFKSSIMIIVANWIKRTIGIFSMIILARLLLPEDYGLVAISSLVIKFVELFTETGISQYILSRKNLTKEMLDSAWSLKLVTRFLISIVVVISAPFASTYFEQENLEAVLYVCALIPIIDGLASPGVFYLSRELKYKSIAILSIVTKLSAFGGTLILAIIYQSYWALVIGDLVFALTYTIGTYIVYPYMPRFKASLWKEQWKFSKWIYLRGLFGYGRAKLDVFIISKYYGAYFLGIYSLAKEIAILPDSVVTRPLSDIFITAINKNKDDLVKTADAVIKLFTCSVAVMLPASVGIYLLAPLLIPVLLGDKWISAIPIAQGLAALALTYGATGAFSRALVALEKVEAVFYLNVLTFCITLPIMVYATSESFEFFAYTRSLVGVMIFSIFFLYLRRLLPIRLDRIFVAILPTIIAAALMVIVINLLLMQVSTIPALFALLLLILAGFFSYVSAFLLLTFMLAPYSEALSFIKVLVKNTMSKFSGITSRV